MVALLRWQPRPQAADPQAADPQNGRVYASATSMAELGARMTSLEKAHYTFRDEIRSDLKDIEALMRAKD